MGVVEANNRMADGVLEDWGYMKLAELYHCVRWLEDHRFRDAILDAFLGKLQSPRSVDLPGPECTLGFTTLGLALRRTS